MKKNILKQYQEEGKLEVGLDEAGRGCLFGPVCVAGVIWLNEDPENCIEIKDSKRCTEKYRLICYDTIIKYSKAYSIQMIDNDRNFHQCKGGSKCTMCQLNHLNAWISRRK